MEDSIMNSRISSIFLKIIVPSLICLFVSTNIYGGQYDSLNGLTDINVVFDVRAKRVKKAVIYLDLIHETFKDQNIRDVSKQPEFAVVLAGGMSKFVSSNTEGFSDGEKVLISRVTDRISAMAKDGIKVEICVFSVNLAGVDPATLMPVIKQVDNGWISLIGYQAKGYSLVSAL
jgi:uncharacterized protein